jgi:hypothetical protein
VILTTEAVPPWNLGGEGNVFAGKTQVVLTLKGKGAPRALRLNAQGARFTVNAPVTLILDENITLQGRTNNNASLVWINGSAALEMKGGKGKP